MINRGNDRRLIFPEDVDYERFLHLLQRAKRQYPVRLFGFCLMPNHFHALIQPQREGALSAYLQWVQGRYACDLRSLTNTVGHGHVFQRRFWNSAIEDTRHFLSVLRYIEANPVRSALVTHAASWAWSSAALRGSPRADLLDPLPCELPENWLAIVNGPQPLPELLALRQPVRPGRPVEATKSLVGRRDPIDAR